MDAKSRLAREGGKGILSIPFVCRASKYLFWNEIRLESEMKVGFIGLGHMGSAMAANLLRAGHELIVYNRTPDRADKLRQDGAKVAANPAMAAPAEVVITMLSDDAAVEQVVFGANGIMNSMPRGGIHVSMSTISVPLSERLAREHEQNQTRFVAAPVFGRPDAAQAGKLFIVAAGAKDACSDNETLFSVMGQKTFHVGEHPPMANIVKLSGNFLIASMIESLGEAFALVRKHGVDPNTYLDILTNSLFSAPVYKTYGGIIAEGKYEPVGFRAELGLKDVRLALQAAESSAVPMPIASVVHDRFVQALARGMADADWSSIAKVAAEDAGLKAA
jgi:3-hydroxyisobutyrate dehydrogenase-like beta-hydroxyacid dehydrogenase